MGQLIPWLLVTISGFVYVCAIFFFLLALAGKYDLNFKGIKDYLPYIAILVIFISYVIGYTMHLTFEKILLYILPELKKPASDILDVPQKLSKDMYKTYLDLYSNFVMFRHLVIATSLLGISLYIWFRKSRMQKFKWYSLIICAIFIIFFLVAYLQKRESLIEINQLISSLSR